MMEELCQACENGEDAKVEKILANGDVDVNGKDAQNFTALQHAMAYNHPRIVRKLLAITKTQLDMTDNGGWTALHWACHWNNVECIKLFTTDNRCTDQVLNMKNNAGESALMFAVSWGNLESVKALAELPGIDFATKTNDEKSLVDVARTFNHQHVVDYLENHKQGKDIE